MKRINFVIASAYDTETTNIGFGDKTRAFPVLFIDNDLRGVDLYNYDYNNDKVNFFRTTNDMLDRIKEYIQWGLIVKKTPIICAYNLMFDLQPLMYDLDKDFDIRVNAQSSTNVYTLDLYEHDTDNFLLRFWDTYHLEMRGLSAMGETAGLPKAIGDWDYSKIRTPQTQITDKELYYAKRDVQVIPMYLRYLLHSNEWLKPEDLGNRVLTKTSIVRQMARREIGPLTVDKINGKKLTLDKAFITKCIKQLPYSYGCYALRKACFRGGFTFTSAATAGLIVENVASLDVTSMHHTFINGRYIPEDFEPATKELLQLVCNQILKTSIDHVLENYERPFKNAIHARIKFINIRLKKDSVFDKLGIGLLSSAKFKKSIDAGNDVGLDPKNVAQENDIRSNNWHDNAINPIFAFGKLYSASECVLHLSELELWNVGQVYDFDDYIPITGEVTGKFRVPPDFVTLQSNELFEMKTKAKVINKNYKQGVPYTGDLTGIPDGIATELKNGECDSNFFESWYISTVKGMFNGIYGTMAQDVYKPSYIEKDGELIVDENSKTTIENFDDKNTFKTLRVLYTYGLRIVGGSRMHMILSMQLLYNALGDKCKILGGDTDSMKVALNKDVSDDDLDKALEPIAIASEKAIAKTMHRIRKVFPDKASKLTGIGSFDIENRGAHYLKHIELWNKCRVSYDGSHFHVTCAGLSRPSGLVNIETIMDAFSTKYNVDDVLKKCLGYNVCVMPSVSHSLEHHKPKATDIYDNDVTDYMGNVYHVKSHQSSSLYPAARWLGETLKFTNLSSVNYLLRVYNRKIDTKCRYIEYKDNVASLKEETVAGLKTIMKVTI